MHVLLSIVLVHLIPALVYGECGSPCDTLAVWRSILFAGLDKIPKKGSWSRVLTFKDTAHTALVGDTYDDGLIGMYVYLLFPTLSTPNNVSTVYYMGNHYTTCTIIAIVAHRAKLLLLCMT